MKDKKFLILIVLVAIWLVLFLGLLFGMKVNPRLEEALPFLILGWGTYWTLSFLFSKKPTDNSKQTKPDNTGTDTNSK